MNRNFISNRNLLTHFEYYFFYILDSKNGVQRENTIIHGKINILPLQRRVVFFNRILVVEFFNL